jgi:crossover junction endodeoxyribonuclease RusA
MAKRTLPLEFTIPGPPVSHQSRNRARLKAWRASVRSAAEATWKTAAPLNSPLKLTVTYYHEGDAVRIDNDNMLKPIQDALIGLVYDDDRRITDTVVRKTSIDLAFVVRGYSLRLLRALARGDEFLHVVIDTATGHKNPLR